MKRRACYDAGNVAMVDAMLFMTVMLLASGTLLSMAGNAVPEGAVHAGNRQYAEDFAATLLASELSGMSYIDVYGNDVSLGDSGISIYGLLCDQAMVLQAGSGMSDFSEYESRILAAGDSIIRPGMGFAITCNDSVFISRATALPHDRYAEQMAVVNNISSGVPVVITVYVWVL